MSFTCNFFAYFQFHNDWGRVIGKIKQNELDCRDTAPLSVNEVDVVVVVLKLSGESVLLSGMDVEVFEKGKNSRKRFTIYVTLRNVHKDV